MSTWYRGNGECESAEAIASSAGRMNTMSQDRVDAARPEAGQLRVERQAADSPGFVASLRRQQVDALEMGRVWMEAPEGLPAVSADPARPECILVDLLANKLECSGPGKEVTMSSCPRDRKLLTAVTGRGAGVMTEDLPPLFQRDFQAGPAVERGPGLGLCITPKLMEAHGGRISVESRVGAESSLWLSLPVRPEGEGK